VGITRAKRKPTKLHPYGYMRDKFVFSLISAVGIFCLGAGVSVWHGCAGLLAAEPVEHIAWSVAGEYCTAKALFTSESASDSMVLIACIWSRLKRLLAAQRVEHIAWRAAGLVILPSSSLALARNTLPACGTAAEAVAGTAHGAHRLERRCRRPAAEACILWP